MADKVQESDDQFRQGIESAFEALSERYSEKPQATQHGWTYAMDGSVHEFNYNRKTHLVMLQSQHPIKASSMQLAQTAATINSDTLLGYIQVENESVKIKSEVVVHPQQDAEKLE